MSTHRGSSGLFFMVACAGLAASSGAFAVSACSSSTAEGTADGGDAATDGRRVVDGGGDPDSMTPEQCVAQCAIDHPSGMTKYNAIDTCWAANCQAPCVDQSGGFDAGDAGDAGGADSGVDAGGVVCGTDVSSGVDTTCDRCTEAFCCTAWKGCFGDTDCTAYNKCLGICNP